ncbi:hypothetical protein ILUMI_16480 [Ignelater luminosus]|uniref:C2H2-type domain-containing protein n=1 Tax=Ignelater luminosus TaxID=2038154 RepID=A0A8K0G8W9_IGNLU|nr:hypothetical protein ILUMI_16480 [Ignelater luminosus]
MNFTSFRNNSNYCNKRLPTTFVNLCNSESSDITSSIVDSLEKGTFFESQETKLHQFFRVDIKRELDDILSWLNSDLMPHMKNEATKYDRKNLQECINKAQLIKQKFSEICKFFRYCRQKRHLENHNFTCVTCKKLITLPLHSNLIDSLLQHEHIEIRFAHAVEGCIFADNKSDTSLHSIMSQVDIIPCSSAQETTKEKRSPVDNTIQIKDVTINNVMERENQCCLLASYLANFKFNFEIKYDSKVEQQLYYPKHIEHDVKNIDGLGQPTFQFKTRNPQLFMCLICCCEIPTYASYRMLKEHVQGHRHTKKKETPKVLEAFFSYHDHWMKEEPKYQAHQVHFLPKNVFETVCVLCNRLTVPYDLLESHIKSNAHKERFFDVLKKNKLRLLNLQAEVYVEEGCSNNSFASSEETTNGETDSYLDEISDEDVLLNTSIVIENTEKGSNVEGLKMHKDENKAGVSNKHVISNSPSNSKVRKETSNLKRMESVEKNCMDNSKSHSESTEENSDLNKSKNKYKNHVIVKSVLNEKGTELEDLLENRLLPHLKVFNKLNDKQIECKSCNVKVQNNIVLVRDHICSKGHQAKSNILNLMYQFHCEICNIVLKDNHGWKEHMRMSRHVEKCDKLGACRKTRLTEYECKTCKLVIFGDELSLKRHIGAYGKSAWLRKNRGNYISNDI